MGNDVEAFDLVAVTRLQYFGRTDGPDVSLVGVRGVGNFEDFDLVPVTRLQYFEHTERILSSPSSGTGRPTFTGLIVGSGAATAILSVRFRTVQVRSRATKKAILSAGFRTASVRSGAVEKAVGMDPDRSGAVDRAILSVGFNAVNRSTRSAGSGVANMATLSVGFSAVNRDTSFAGSGAANRAIGFSAVNRGTPSVGSGAVNTTPAKPGVTAARVRECY